MNTPAEIQCLALIPCEYVHTSAGGQQQTVVGTFTAVEVPSVPTGGVRFAVYASFLGLVGDAEAAVRLHSPSGEEVAALSVAASSDDARSVQIVTFAFEDVTVAESGTHDLRLEVDSQLVASRPLHVELLEGER